MKKMKANILKNAELKRRYNLRKYIFVILSAVVFSFFISNVYGAPVISVNETGNITSFINNLTGTIQLDDNYEYRGFSATLNDFYYYNSSIPRFSNFILNYTRSFNETFFNEKIDFFMIVDTLTVRYNLSNSFNSSINVSMFITLPGLCEYNGFEINGGLNGSVYDDGNLTLEFQIPAISNRIVNVTCLGTGVGSDLFPPVSYVIKTEEIIRNYRFGVLPRAYFSATKERLGLDDGTDGFGVLSQNTTWRAGFEFTNADDIPLNITKINLWAVPVVNTTNNPRENIIYDGNFTDCLNSVTNVLQRDEVCRQSGTFSSRYVPTIWSEVSYDVIWDFLFRGVYFFEGNSSVYDFDFFIVDLVNPENASYADFEETIDLGFNVSEVSDCSLYSNVTGTWRKEPGQELFNVSEGNFSLTTFDYTGYFVWNVFCFDVEGFNANFARHNYTINVNALQELYQEIPDLEWPMYSNYTLNMTDYFSDFEGDHLNFTHLPNPVINITIDINNITGQIIFIPDNHFYGERTAQIVSIDPFGREVKSNLFLLNVTRVYLPPEIIFWNITNGTWWTTEDTYVEVPVNTTLNFTADATHPQPWFPDPLPGSWFYWFIDGVLQEIGRFFSWHVDFFWVGERNVTLVVNDTFGMYDYQTWIVNATRIDVPPQLREIPNIAWKQNTTHTMNLNDWFYDIYKLDDNFTFSYVGHLENLSVVLDNNINIINFTPDTNWIGVEERWMIINATDKYNLTTISNNFTLTVYPWIIKPIDNVSFFVDGWNDTINLSEHFNDEYYDWADLFWSAFADNLNFVLNPVTGILNITSVGGWTGNQTVLMKVNNTFGWDDYTEFNVEVIPFNHPPEINDTDYYMMQNTTPPYDWIDLWNISYDPDDKYEDLRYEILSQSNTSLMTCEIVENRYINCTAPPPELWGVTELNVSVSDRYFSDTARIRIFVEKYIHPPDINDWNITSEKFFIEMADEIYDLEFFENSTLLFQVNTTDRENRPSSHFWWFNDTLISTTTNTTIYFDFHSSGNYTVRYFVNNSEGGYAEKIWNLIVVNKNRPPFPVNLTAPPSGSFITEQFTFNWTNTTDPDAERPNEDDFWDFVYILQVARDNQFRNLVLDIQFKNITSYALDTFIPDGFYYWRVIAFDGLDSGISEVWNFTLDMNPPKLSLEIEPKIAEYQLRNVSIIWSAYDVFLEDAYINVSYPNGTLLGTYYTNITLTPAELVVPGKYEVKLFAIDRSNHTSLLKKNFDVVVDTEPPKVKLIDPRDDAIVASDTVIFTYSVEDINHPYECILYIQKMNIIYDIAGGIMHMAEAGPWVPVLWTRLAKLGENHFVYAPFEEDSYRWNVRCTDISGNHGFAEHNRTFRVMLRDVDILLPVDDIDDTVFEPITHEGYSLKSRIFPIKSKTGEIVSGILELENTGRRAIYDLSFLPSVNWVEFEEGIAYMQPGEKINVSYRVRSPVHPGEFIYHVGIFSNHIRQLTSGYIEVIEDAEVPLRVIKRVYEEEVGYRITLTIINYLKHRINIYVEDSIAGMKDVSFSKSDFVTSGTSPPYLALSRVQIQANETITVSYTAKEIDVSVLRKPLVISNVDYISTLEVVSPHYFNVLVFKKTYVEIILITIFVSILILFFGYSLYLKIKEKDDFLS